MSDRYNFLPNESIHEYHARLKKVQDDYKEMDILVSKMNDVFIRTDRVANGLGVWAGLFLYAFGELDEEARTRIKESVKRRDQELILEKLGK